MSDDGGPLGMGLMRRSREKGILGMGILNLSREDLKTQAKSQAAQYAMALVMQEANSRGFLRGGMRDRLLRMLRR